MKQINGLLLLAVAAAILSLFLPSEFFRHLVVMTVIFGLFAAGYNAQFGYAGLLNLGHAAFFGLGAYVSAISTLHWGWSVWLGFVLGMLVAAILALLVGLLSLRMRGAQFAMMTLGLGQLCYLFVINSVDLTRGPLGISGVPVPVMELGGLRIAFDDERSYIFLALAFLLVACLALRAILNSRLGSAWQCVRENEDLAASLGINAGVARITAFIFGSVLAAAAGGLYAHYIRLVTPELLSVHYTVMALIVVVIGGQGSFFGPLIGAVMFTIVPEALRFTADMRMALFGLLLLGFVLFLPDGLAPSIRDLGRRLRRAPAGGSGVPKP